MTGPRIKVTPELRRDVERRINAKYRDEPRGRREYQKFRALCGMHTIRPRPTARRVSRLLREWIETYGVVKDKRGEIVRFTAHNAQRKVLAALMRAWRNESPARIWCLKPRQIGFSTICQLIVGAVSVLEDNQNACVLAHKELATSAITRIFRTFLKHLPYRLPTDRMGQMIEFSEPHNSIIDLSSDSSENPGHGLTLRLLHLTEVSRWKNADETVKGILPTVPKSGRNAVISESTANMAAGYFYTGFMRAWNGESGDAAVFIAWFEHEEYVFDYISEGQRREIMETLSDEEAWLLQQRYFVRKVGWRNVSVEQLAWRRHMIESECHGDLDSFHQQYPATVEEAFLTSGRPVFDAQAIWSMLQRVEDPIFVGDIENLGYEPPNLPTRPEPSAQEEVVPIEIVPEKERAAILRAHGTSLPIDVEEPEVGHDPDRHQSWPGHGKEGWGGW